LQGCQKQSADGQAVSRKFGPVKKLVRGTKIPGIMAVADLGGGKGGANAPPFAGY